jgi:hypothetical protein
MTTLTNTKSPVAHLSARIALQSAQHHAVRTVRRVSAVDTSAADPGVASRMRWARAVLKAATTGKATEI